MLENETSENFFAKYPEEKGEEVQKIEEKIRYLRRDAFVDVTHSQIRVTIRVSYRDENLTRLAFTSA